MQYYWERFTTIFAKINFKIEGAVIKWQGFNLSYKINIFKIFSTINHFKPIFFGVFKSKSNKQTATTNYQETITAMETKNISITTKPVIL